LGYIDFDTRKASFAEQAEALSDGDIDLFLVETCHNVAQIRAALNAIEEVFAKKGDRTIPNNLDKITMVLLNPKSNEKRYLR
jgi:methionine synthase I (cobalamin-dependent)